MRKYILALFFTGLLISCGNNQEHKNNSSVTIGTKTTAKKPEAIPTKVESGAIDMSNKGVGPFASIEFKELNTSLADKGQELFKMNCTACHKTDKKFIGPALQDIFDRRSPEWTANMIINPERMVKEDPIARQLLIDHNGSPMANQGLSEEEVLAILEYFRTL